ncbi:MAG: hypothetical protein HY843_08115 [Bdellovibrio sp.]|nr:hypothetical protein [Bdellovibrio sp.]
MKRFRLCFICLFFLFPLSGFSATETSTFDLGDLKYNHYKPQWGVELNMSPYQINNDLFEIPDNTPIWLNHYTIQVEFQPRFVQPYGVLGIGLLTAIHTPSSRDTGTKQELVYSFSLGGELRYQLCYFRNQFIVPNVAYSWEFWKYRLRNNNSSGNLIVQGPTIGAWLLLNFFDSENGKDFFYDYGIARTYLIFEARFLKGSNSSAAMSGRAYYTGLRFEF